MIREELSEMHIGDNNTKASIDTLLVNTLDNDTFKEGYLRDIGEIIPEIQYSRDYYTSSPVKEDEHYP